MCKPEVETVAVCVCVEGELHVGDKEKEGVMDVDGVEVQPTTTAVAGDPPEQGYPPDTVTVHNALLT